MKRLISVISLVLCFLLVCIPAAATQSQLDKVGEKIDVLEEETKEQKEELEKLKKQKQELDSQKSEISKRVDALAEELLSIQEQLDTCEQSILECQQHLEAAREQEKVQYENMKLRIRFLYEHGDVSIMQAFLQADNFAEVLNFGNYVENLYSYDRQMLEEYQLLAQDISLTEQTLAEQQENLLMLKSQKEEALSANNLALARIVKEISASSQQIEMKADELARYEEQLAKQLAYEEELERKLEEEEKKQQEEAEKDQNNSGNTQKPENPEDTKTPYVPADEATDLALLAAIIECEAGGEPYEGQLAVGSVVLNRVESSRFPNTILEVLYQKNQFTPVSSGRFQTVLNRGAKASCVQAAKETLAGKRVIDALFFRNKRSGKEGTIIGNHVFY